MSKASQTGRSRSTRARGPSARGLIMSAVVIVGITACESGHWNVADGSARDAKGKVEVIVGDVTGDQRTKDNGQMDQDKGKGQKTVGKVQEKIDATIKTQ